MGNHAADGVDGAGLATLSKSLDTAGVVVTIIAPHVGTISSDVGPVAVTESAIVTLSVEYDALIIAGGEGVDALVGDPYIATNLAEAFRHYKPIGAWGMENAVLESCGIGEDSPGVVTEKSSTKVFAASVIEAVGWHRFWERE